MIFIINIGFRFAQWLLTFFCNKNGLNNFMISACSYLEDFGMIIIVSRFVYRSLKRRSVDPWSHNSPPVVPGSVS